MKLSNLRDLFLMELKDLYSAESQLLKVLPRMAKAASSPQLQQAFQEHIEQTRGQVERLNQIFQQLNTTGRGRKCEGMEGVLKESEDVLEQEADPEVKDAALISCAQKVEHYEMAGYGTCRTFARMLGAQECADLLEQTLNEEKMTDKKLSRLAEGKVNIKARKSGAAGETALGGVSGKESGQFPKENPEDLNI